MLNEYLVLMKSRGISYLVFFTSIFLLLGISTCSSHCNTTEDCKNTSSSLLVCCDSICLLTDSPCLNGSTNTNSNSSSTNNFPKNFNDAGNMANTTQVYDTVNLNRSQYAVCSKDGHCNSSNTICVSLECWSKNSDTIEDCERCESIGCIDGRCYNLTRLVPTTTATKGTITTLQLVLLFGSMGGIVIFIIIVYCVKTFTDNRRRQYLLKHGVWDNPKDGNSKDKAEDGESKSDSSRQQRKLEVPTITVETETESKKKKRKKKEESKDEITDTDGLEEFAVQQECKRGKDLHVKERRKILSGCASKGCQTY